MKQNINEIKRMQRIAGLITESEYQESYTIEEGKLGNFLNQIKTAAMKTAKNYFNDASGFVDIDKLEAEPIPTDILNKAEKELANKSQELSEGFKDNIAKFASGNILGAVVSGLTTLSTGLDYLDQRFTQWYYSTIQGMAEKDVMKVMVDTYGAKAAESSIWFKVGMYAFFVFFVLTILSLITLKIMNRKK